MSYYIENNINQLIEIDDTKYWCQGYNQESEISMYREIEEILECEKDYIQTIMSELE